MTDRERLLEQVNDRELEAAYYGRAAARDLRSWNAADRLHGVAMARKAARQALTAMALRDVLNRIR